VTDFEILLHVFSRFIHIISAILLLGGVFYARLVLTPVLNILPEDKRMQAAAGAQLRYRATLFTLVALSLLSGVYNFLQTSHSRQYHIAFGIKMLAVLHIYATAILWATSPYGDVNFAGKSKRRLLSITIAGFIVVLISAYLRSLTLAGV
jgi:uncharacterized membrane protein